MTFTPAEPGAHKVTGRTISYGKRHVSVMIAFSVPMTNMSVMGTGWVAGTKVTVKLDDEEVSGSPFTVDVGTPPTLFTGIPFRPLAPR